MYEDIVQNELGDDWEYVGPSDDAAFEEEEHIIAEHCSGATCSVMETEHHYFVSFSQPLEHNGLEVCPSTHARGFKDRAMVGGYLRDVAESISDGTASIDVIALLAHDGTPESISIDQLDSQPDSITADGELRHSLADVWAVRTAQLPEEVSVEYLRENIHPLIELTYGMRTDIPDILTELESPDEAYADSTIEVFTVSVPDGLSLAETT